MTVLSFGQEMLGFLSIQLADVVLLCFWFGLYGMVAAMEVMVPEAVRVSKAKKLEWDMRIVSNVHAVVLFIGGVLTYMECQKLSDHELVFGYSFIPDVCARIFRAYLVYDFVLCTACYSLLKDPGSIVHHALFLLVTTYALSNSYFKFQFAWLTAGELSTPFVNLRWQLAVTDQKNSPAYVVNGILLTMAFFIARVLAYTYGLHHMLFRIRYVWVTEETPPGMYLLAAGLLAGFLLNLFWFSIIMKGVIKLLRKRKAD